MTSISAAKADHTHLSSQIQLIEGQFAQHSLVEKIQTLTIYTGLETLEAFTETGKKLNTEGLSRIHVSQHSKNFYFVVNGGTLTAHVKGLGGGQICSKCKKNNVSSLNRQLYEAGCTQDWEEVYRLLDEGADINANLSSHYESPLLQAVSATRIHVAAKLIERGAEVTSTSLISLAVRQNDPKMLSLLIANNAAMPDDALFNACKDGHEEIARQLVKANTLVALTGYNGVDLHPFLFTDIQGDTPLNLARNRGWEDIALLIRAKGAIV